MKYVELIKECKSLHYQEKLKLSHQLIQWAIKEVETHHPQDYKSARDIKEAKPATKDINSIEYITSKLSKLRPHSLKTLLNSIRSMYQFHGGLSEKDSEAILMKLEQINFLKVREDKSVEYLYSNDKNLIPCHVHRPHLSPMKNGKV